MIREKIIALTCLVLFNFSSIGQVQKVFFSESSLNDSIVLNGDVSINVFFSSDSDLYAKFKRNIAKHFFDGDVNFFTKGDEIDQSFEVLSRDLRSSHILLNSDFEWDYNKFNELLNSKSINYKFEKLEKTSNYGESFTYELRKSKEFCQDRGDYEEFFPIIDLLLTDRGYSLSSVERISYINSKKQKNDIEYLKKSNQDLFKYAKDLDVKMRNLESLLVASDSMSKSHIDFFLYSNSLIPDFNNRFISGKINFLGSKEGRFYFSIGYLNIHKQWSSSVSGYSNLIKTVNAENDFDISITGKDIQDRIDLNVHSFTLGLKCEGKLSFGLDFFIPVASELTSENVSGVFDYVGISSDVFEPLLDIPELGLRSNVSYKGQIQRYNNVMKPSVMFNLGMPIKMGERMKLKFSLNYIISRQFKNIQTYDELTHQMGSYNGLIQYSNYSNKPKSSFLFGLGLILDIN
jgi:hypothetical protein